MPVNQDLSLLGQQLALVRLNVVRRQPRRLIMRDNLSMPMPDTVGCSGAHWGVRVDGRTFEVTRGAYAGLQPHEAIRAEMGAGSHAVLNVDCR